MHHAPSKLSDILVIWKQAFIDEKSGRTPTRKCLFWIKERTYSTNCLPHGVSLSHRGCDRPRKSFEIQSRVRG